MKLSNFVMTRMVGSHTPDLGAFMEAEVDETTGILWWKKTERKVIRRQLVGDWRFVETGKLTPELQAEKLEMAWRAKAGQNT